MVKLGRSRLFTSAVANYAGQITVQAVGVLLTPFIIARLGDTLYGVWILVVAVQGLAGLLDVGITTSVVKYVAAHHAAGETDDANRVVASSCALHLVLGVLALGGSVLLAWFGLPLLHLDAAQLPVARQALVVAGATLLVNMPLGVLASVLTGLRHYEIGNAITIVQTVLAAIAIVIALQNGLGPVALVAINGVGLVAASALKAVAAFRLYSGLQLAPRLANWSTLRRVGHYSLWVFLLDAASKIFYNGDAILIASFLPVSALAAYNLGFKLASAISFLSGPFVAIFFPTASALAARDDTAQLQRLLLAGTRLAVLVTMPAALWLAFFGRPVLTWWIGSGRDEALPVLYLFLAVFLISAAQNPAATILRAIGRVRPLVGVIVVEYSVNIVLSALLIPRVGVVGAALGTLVPVVGSGLFVIPWLACRTLALNYWQFTVTTLRGPLVAGLLAAALLWPLRLWAPAPEVAAVAGGCATILLFGVVYWWVGASADERLRIDRWLTGVVGRRAPTQGGGTV